MPAIDFEVLDRRAGGARNPGVVNREIESPESLNGLFDGSLNSAGIGHIRLYGERSFARGIDPFADLEKRREATAHEGHICPSCEESFSDCLAVSGAGTGDERDVSGEFLGIDTIQGAILLHGYCRRQNRTAAEKE